MRKVVIAAALLALSLPAHAADKAQPATATLDQIMSIPERKAATCHVEASAAGTFLRADREAQGGIGGGCDMILANILVGGGLRADFADWRNTGSVFVKLGLVLNSGLHFYGWAEYKVKDIKFRDSGQAIVGAGSEFRLDLVSPNIWLFTEAGATASEFGRAFQSDELTIRAGARYKF